MTQKSYKKIAIFAGEGSLPRQVYEAAKKQKKECFVVGLEGNVCKSDFKPEDYEEYPVHYVGKIIEAIKFRGIEHVVLAGRVSRGSISKLLLDIKGAKLFAKIVKNGLNDNAVLHSLIKFLENEGFTIVSADSIATDLVAEKGSLTDSIPSDAVQKDIKQGYKILQGVANFDVGQSLVIQDGLVLGVEAAEGTDELIKRCGSIQQKLGEEGAILIKIVKPAQDKRVDLPCVGVHTIDMLDKYGLQGVAIEAGYTIILDKKATIEAANEKNIFIYGV